MVEITYQMVLSTLQTVGILVGIFYYIMTIRTNQKNQKMQLETRQAQLYMNLYTTYHNPEFRKQLYKLMNLEWKDIDEWNEKYVGTGLPETVAFGSVMGYFNGMGLLVKKGLIDADTVYELLSTFIVVIWEKHLPIMQAMRVRYNRPVWDGFEYLYNEVKKIDQQYSELKT